MTYLEIYNEEVRDLLGNNPHQSLEVKERPDIGVFVKDLTGKCLDYISLINKKRVIILKVKPDNKNQIIKK